MNTIKDLQIIVEKALTAQNFIQDPKGLYEPIDYTMKMGGKRIRPTLCLAACQLFKEDIEEAINPALGLEIFHNFTLLHDDIMDQADVRRNQPTVHIKWDPNTAILSGDAMLIKAYQYIGQLDGEKLKLILALFNQTALEVCEGQQFDMEFETRSDVKVDEYIEMIRLKTAVLLAASLKTGAIIGDASKQQADLLYSFGENIGLGFQLQDDFLDVYGDYQTFGKAIGGDILANKKTFLLINALQLATGSVKDELTHWIKAESFDPEQKINAVKEIYHKVGVAKLAKDKMDYYFNRAIKALLQVDGENEMTRELKSFAHNLIERIR